LLSYCKSLRPVTSAVRLAHDYSL